MIFNDVRQGTAVAGASLAAALLIAGASYAADITYAVDQTIGGGSVVGTITTDGASGTLNGSDIVGWNLELNGVGASYNLKTTNSNAYVVGSDLTATPKDLDFNFSGGDNGYLLFQVIEFSGFNYYCDATSAVVCFQGKSVVPQEFDSPSAQNVPASGNQVIGTAVPEPVTWATMLLGLCAVGGALRSRRFRTA
ncbi:MAG TPA: PEPxxWA-CTERM sorting domain-containing protein [Caulobacteraceae bacterium]|jgi:hypothetical protein|nr:PEPxxWA-CTERM sorting domain-containing protein [Caulobacteraceae bacterium]